MRRPLSVSLLLAIILLTACSTAAPQPAAETASAQTEQLASAAGDSTLTVFAAASLNEVFMDLGQAFEAANPGVEVVMNFAGSQQLAQQLAQGAPADVYASANLNQVQALVEAGLVDEDAPKVFANNRLIVVVPADNPGGIATLQDLAKPGLKLVLAAPEVPAGAYAQEFLKKAAQDPAFGADFEENVLKNVVSYEENVRAVLSKVLLGEADAGITYTSDLTPATVNQLAALEIPDEINSLALYYITPVSESSQPALAERFISFVLSPEGQQILSQYGFLAVQ